MIFSIRKNMKPAGTLALCLYAVLMFAALGPGTACAYENEFEISLAPGTGTYEYTGGDSDLTSLTFGVSYTRYFGDITTDESPYGARQFLQHLPWMGVMLSSQAAELDDNYSTYTSEQETTSLGLGAQFYTPSGAHSTGFGLIYFMQDTDIEDRDSSGIIDKDDISRDTLYVMVEQYVSRPVSLALVYESTDYENRDESGSVSEYDQDTFSFDVSALMDNRLWIRAGLETGEREYPGSTTYDIDGITVEFGMYPVQQVGVFFTLDKETIDYGSGSERESKEFTVRGDFYFNESVHMDVALSRESTDYSPGGNNIDEQRMVLTYGTMF